MELHDQQDVANDYIKILSVFNSIWSPPVLKEAYCLDVELREKYKTIDLLFHSAETMSDKASSDRGVGFDYPPEIKALQQDYFGIAADVLLKKGIIKTVNDFIESVD